MLLSVLWSGTREECFDSPLQCLAALDLRSPLLPWPEDSGSSADRVTRESCTSRRDTAFHTMSTLPFDFGANDRNHKFDSHSLLPRRLIEENGIEEISQNPLTSPLPLPNPLMTFPSRRSGKGGAGPSSGPAKSSRGPSGRILTSLQSAWRNVAHRDVS